jgi:hypothetical protein
MTTDDGEPADWADTAVSLTTTLATGLLTV